MEYPGYQDKDLCPAAFLANYLRLPVLPVHHRLTAAVQPLPGNYPDKKEVPAGAGKTGGKTYPGTGQAEN